MSRHDEIAERIAELESELDDLREEYDRTRPRDTRKIDKRFEADLNDLIEGTLEEYRLPSFEELRENIKSGVYDRRGPWE